jgi:MFS transporter, DHA2 family, multidrug resistance protein
MPLVTDKFWVRFYFFFVLLVCSYNHLGQSLSFNYVEGYFGVSSQDAYMLLRGFHAGTIITSIAGLVFIKWLGNRWLFIGAAVLFFIATIFSFKATDFTTLLTWRIIAGVANGFMIAVATQLFLATYPGKEKLVGALFTVAANVAGLSISLIGNSAFTEDFGWQFNYYLSLPALLLVIGSAFFFVPVTEKNEEIEEDWLSLLPFSVLIISLLFLFLYREQYHGISHPKILLSLVLIVISGAILLIRGAIHKKPLFDTRLLQYPAFSITIIVSFLVGGLFVFTLKMVATMLGGILQMPFKDVYHFINFLALVITISLVISFILVVKKVSAYWIMIVGLGCIAFSAYQLSQLNTEFDFNSIVTPSLVAMTGGGMLAISVVIIAIKAVPPNQIGKVANFRAVAFLMGIAIAATNLSHRLDWGRVRNFNSMLRYADPSDEQFMERFNGLKSFYMSKGYDADSAYQAAVNGMTGMIKLQAFFKGLSQLFQVAIIVIIILIAVVFILWVLKNHRMLIDFFTFKNKANENAKAVSPKT